MIMWAYAVLLLMAGAQDRGVESTATQQCPGGELALGGAGLTLVSGQNATGHWLAKVRLEHAAGAAGGGAALRPVSLQLHRFARPLSGGSHAVALEATLAGSSSAAVGNLLHPDGTAAPATACVCPPPNPPARAVPPGYQLHAGLGYYRLHTEPVSWYEAKATCEREGAFLAVINSQEEANMVADYFKKYPIPQDKHGISIGLHDLLQEGTFFTVFGQRLEETGFAVWNSREPNNKGGQEHCGAIWSTGVLNDASCEEESVFICELPNPFL